MSDETRVDGKGWTGAADVVPDDELRARDDVRGSRRGRGMWVVTKVRPACI